MNPIPPSGANPAASVASARGAASPWWWIPTLYFGQGIPYVVVMTLSVVMYKNLNLSNTEIALYTSWLYLPWVIKPLWAPLVDLLGTKRGWIVAMQFLVGAAFALVALIIFGFLRDWRSTIIPVIDPGPACNLTVGIVTVSPAATSWNN